MRNVQWFRLGVVYTESIVGALLTQNRGLKMTSVKILKERFTLYTRGLLFTTL